MTWLFTFKTYGDFYFIFLFMKCLATSKCAMEFKLVICVWLT